MPQPTLSDVHVNVPLTNLSLMYRQDAAAFVALRVFPIIPVSFKSDLYYKFTRADFNRNQMKKRAPGTESAGGGYTLTTDSYNADVWSLHKDIPDQIRANSDSVLQPDLEATQFLTMQALISREVDWASNFFAHSKWNTEWTGVTTPPGTNQFLQWQDPASTPIIDVRSIKRAMQIQSGGFRPNKMVLGRTTFDRLCDHPDFIDRIKYGQTPGRPAQVTLDAMAALFELDEVLVMDAIQNTGTEGQTITITNTLETNAFIADKAALLVYTPSAPGIQTPGCGYTFAWTGFFGATAQGTRIKSFYMPWLESTRVEIDAAYAHKQASADMGAFMYQAVA